MTLCEVWLEECVNQDRKNVLAGRLEQNYFPRSVSFNAHQSPN